MCMVSKKMRREWIVIRRATVRSLFTSRRSRRVDLEEVWCGVSRHDIAFVPGASRLMSLWKGESHLVFGIGGHLRTVVDWYLVRGRSETAVGGCRFLIQRIPMYRCGLSLLLCMARRRLWLVQLFNGPMSL